MNELCIDFFEILIDKNFSKNDFLKKVEDFFKKHDFEKNKIDFALINKAFKNINLESDWSPIRELFSPLQKIFNYEIALKYFANAMESIKYKTDDYYSKIISRAREIELDAIEYIQSTNLKITIEILGESKESILDGYERVKNHFLNENFEDSWRLARDIFQRDLEENFNSSIKHFENKTDSLSKKINSLLSIIRDIRNDYAKTGTFAQLPKNEQIAITKLSIEQLINIRNFLFLVKE